MINIILKFKKKSFYVMYDMMKKVIQFTLILFYFILLYLMTYF